MAHAKAAAAIPSGAKGDRNTVTSWENASFATTHAVVSALLYCLSLRGLYRLARMFGTLEWLINYKRRRRFAVAFEQVLGRKPTPTQRRRATREYFWQSRCNKLFYLVFDRLDRDKCMALFSIRNRGLLDTAVHRGRGVYLAMSHQGPYHIAGMLLALNGYKTTAVRDRQEGGMRRWIQRRFDRLYPEFGRMRVLYSDSYPRDIYRCFKEGYVLGSAMDVGRLRRTNQKAEEVTIFGQRRLFLSGPLRVAIRCEAPVLQVFIVPQENFRYRLDVVEMLVDPMTIKDEDTAVAQAMSVYAANVEKYLRATPALITRT